MNLFSILLVSHTNKTVLVYESLFSYLIHQSKQSNLWQLCANKGVRLNINFHNTFGDISFPYWLTRVDHKNHG